MSAEDGLADTMRPRLDAAGADVNRVYAIEGVPIVGKRRCLRPPTLADIAALEAAISDTGARLLVIDVVMAYLPTGTDSHKDQTFGRCCRGSRARRPDRLHHPVDTPPEQGQRS